MVSETIKNEVGPVLIWGAGAVGGTIGAVSGNALGRASGGLSLKRNLVSEVRKTPAKSIAFSDGSFNHRSNCVDEPLNSTNVNIKNQIPFKIKN